MNIEYENIHSRRKTISIIVDEKGRVKVRAPLRASKKQIAAFVEKNREWIISHVSKRQAIALRHPDIKGEDGELIPYLGEYVRLKITSAKKTSFDGKTLFISSEADPIEQITKWYKKQAKTILADITAKVAEKCGFEYSCVKISSSQKRYGSCSGKNNINYSFRLVMFPPDCITYVVIHELCHTVHKNHSADFWALVKQLCPEYKELQKKMSTESSLMSAV